MKGPLADACVAEEKVAWNTRLGDESDALSQEPLVLESMPAVANGQIFQADSDV